MSSIKKRSLEERHAAVPSSDAHASVTDEDRTSGRSTSTIAIPRPRAPPEYLTQQAEEESSSGGSESLQNSKRVTQAQMMGKTAGRWTKEEHKKFVTGKYPLNLNR